MAGRVRLEQQGTAPNEEGKKEKKKKKKNKGNQRRGIWKIAKN